MMKQALGVGVSALALSLLACSTNGVAPGMPGSQPHPFALQSNAPSPSPWQNEPDIGPPILGTDGRSIWGFTGNPLSAVRLDIATNAIQSSPLTGSIFEGHGGPNGSFSFCGQGQVGTVSAAGVVAYFPEPMGRCLGITTGPDGNIWLTELTSIDRVTTTGQFISFSIPVTGLGGIVSSAKDNDLWFDWYTSSEIGVGTIDPSSGQYALFPMSSGLGGIGGAGLNTGLDGNLYYVPGLDRRTTGEIIRVTTSGKVKRFTNVPKNMGYENSAENVSTVWFGGQDLHLYGWTTQGRQLLDKGASRFGVHYPILGPDMNIWFEGGVYLQRIITVTPQNATLQVGAQQLFSITETDCSQCAWSAKSSNPGVASASPVTSGGFTVTAFSSGSATIVVSDKRYNTVQVPIIVQ